MASVCNSSVPFPASESICWERIQHFNNPSFLCGLGVCGEQQLVHFGHSGAIYPFLFWWNADKEKRLEDSDLCDSGVLLLCCCVDSVREGKLVLQHHFLLSPWYALRRI